MFCTEKSLHEMNLLSSVITCYQVKSAIIRMHSRQRNQKKHDIPGLLKWHSTFHKRFNQFGKDETFDSKRQRFKSHQHLNVEQSHLPFVTDAKRT